MTSAASVHSRTAGNRQVDAAIRGKSRTFATIPKADSDPLAPQHVRLVSGGDHAPCEMARARLRRPLPRAVVPHELSEVRATDSGSGDVSIAAISASDSRTA